MENADGIRGDQATGVPVSRLGVGGSLILFTLRQWVFCFSAGHHPPACLTRPIVQAGCPGVPLALIQLLRALRGSKASQLLFNVPAAGAMTDTELQIMQAFSAATGGGGVERYLDVFLPGCPLQRSEAIRAVRHTGFALKNAGLSVWGDTMLWRVSAPALSQCDYQSSASPDSVHLLQQVGHC